MRELVNFDSTERLRLSVEDKALVSVSQKCAKTKQTKKEFASELRAEFGVLDKICFLDEKTLLVRQYLENKLFCLDIKSAKVTKQPWIKDEYLRVSEFCAQAGKLVVIDQSRGYAINLKSGNAMAEFTLDHVVKSCEAKFIDGKLAVRTDYGCFSLYEI